VGKFKTLVYTHQTIKKIRKYIHAYKYKTIHNNCLHV